MAVCSSQSAQCIFRSAIARQVATRVILFCAWTPRYFMPPLNPKAFNATRIDYYRSVEGAASLCELYLLLDLLHRGKFLDSVPEWAPKGKYLLFLCASRVPACEKDSCRSHLAVSASARKQLVWLLISHLLIYYTETHSLQRNSSSISESVSLSRFVRFLLSRQQVPLVGNSGTKL